MNFKKKLNRRTDNLVTRNRSLMIFVESWKNRADENHRSWVERSKHVDALDDFLGAFGYRGLDT